MDGVYRALIKTFDPGIISDLLKSLCFFNVASNVELKPNDDDPLVAVVHNIITRGLPTRASELVEQCFVETFGRTCCTTDDVGGITYDLGKEDPLFANQLYRALHIIDPRITRREQYRDYESFGEQLGSTLEEDFLFSIIPQYAGEAFVQVLEPQRELESILKYAQNVEEEHKKRLQGSIEKFRKQRVDYSLELPYPVHGKRGMVVEIDGQQHTEPQQHHLDTLRDDALLKADWKKTLRIPAAAFGTIGTALQPFLGFIDNEYCSIIKRNYQSPLATEPDGLDALQFALTPYAVARIQRVMIELIRSGHLALSDKQWSIGIIERDVPCGRLAIKDLRRVFETLFLLEGQGRALPEIQATIYGTKEYSHSKLNQLEAVEDIRTVDSRKHDLLLDGSMLQRSTVRSAVHSGGYRLHATIRSSHGARTIRHIASSKLISYAPLFSEPWSAAGAGEVTAAIEQQLVLPDRRAALRYVLRTVFRKDDFRIGQLAILNRALQLQNVLGLLPTGSGKSLCYQLAGLLQPGISLVVDPIKSLMKDQYDGLVKGRIDAALFINSSLRGSRMKIAHERMTYGEALFIFISPERLQMVSFRERLIYLAETYHNYFSYCVVDEAHCVSEWGHDFRTSYLRLGNNARTFCRRKGAVKKEGLFEPPVPLIGLTATASFDVLSDVQRELEITDDSVIRSHGMERPELHYRVVQTTVDEGQLNACSNPFKKKEHIGNVKQKVLLELLQRIPRDFEEINKGDRAIADYQQYLFYDHKFPVRYAGLIFCPYKSTMKVSVESIFSNLADKMPELKIGMFAGSSSDYTRDLKKSQEATYSDYQDRFINNRLNLLVATKAFGMGIDKPNVRFSIHINYPGSIEGYYQEAGRTGRDGKNALCYILYNNKGVDKLILKDFHNTSFKGVKKEKTVLYELLNEITYPVESRGGLLTQSLRTKLGIDANVRVDHGRNCLEVEDIIGNSFGSLDIKTLELKTITIAFAVERSQQVLQFVRNWIRENNISGLQINTFLQQEISRQSLPGIERMLERAAVGEKLDPVVVGFKNASFRAITEWMKKAGYHLFTEQIVKEAYKYCYTESDFVEKVRYQYWKENQEARKFKEIDITDALRSQLSKAFYQIRDENDSYRAIYRLNVIGVIDDYEIDYNSKAITLFITKKEDRHHIDKLYEYLRRYVSEDRARSVFKGIEGIKGDTIIQKCLAYLIAFIYKEIGKKRISAIDAMEEACNIGILEGNQAFRDFMSVYFGSRYYPSLVEDTRGGKVFDFETVWKYIKISDGNIDNLKHLRGACIRLLTESPDNGAALLLKAFAILAVASDKIFIDEAIQDLKSGFGNYKHIRGLGYGEFVAAVEMYQEQLLSYCVSKRDLVSDVADLLILSYHREWLSRFNNKFIG